MPPTDAPDDPYRRRREAGRASRAETRRRLLAAADELFREQGYAATTVSAIASGADVSLQTLYLAWGSKRALLRAAADAAAVASDLPVEPAEWHATLRAELAEDVGPDPGSATYLGAVSRLFVRVARRSALYWEIHREAAATDREIAADWRAVTDERRRTMAAVAAGVPRGGLRPELTPDAVADTLWALASPELYDLLTVRGDYSPAGFESWLRRTLTAALCVDAFDATRNRARNNALSLTHRHEEKQ